MVKDINKLIQLYGHEKEVKLFEEVFHYYNILAKQKNKDNVQIFEKKMACLFKLSFNTYRKEMALEKLADRKENRNTPES